MPARTTTRRSTLLALFLGVTTTVAIAWIAMFYPQGDHGYGPPSANDLGIVLDESGEYPRYLQLWEGRSATHHVVSYWWMQVSGRSFMISLENYEAQKFDLYSLPKHLRPDSLGDIVMQSWYREAGWPMKALTCAVHWETQIRNEDILYRVEGGIQLPRDRDYQPRALPLMPLWPGFAINVLLYGSLWLGLLWLARGMRRWRRVRRNRCTHCGYPRTGLPADSKCPECGQAP